MKGKFISLTSITIFLILNLPESVIAIPSFARKYNQSCSMCHVSIPKLNSFGEAFRFNGYRIPLETADLVEESPIKLGGKVQKKRWPKKTIWPGEIPGTSPIAIRTMMDFNLKPEEKVKSDFNLPHEVEVISGGNLGPSVSFFVELAIYEEGAWGGLERAFIQFDSPIWNSKILNLKVGQFEPFITPFSKIRRITVEHYITHSFQNGTNPFRIKDPQVGVEVWGIKDGEKGGGLHYGLGVVNGNGTEFGKTNGSYDNNSAKDIYINLSYKFGGLGLSGEKGRLPQGGNWRENAFTLGGFSYLGKGIESDFSRRGVHFRVQYQDLDLFGVALFGNDSFIDSTNTEMVFSAYFIEANYTFLPWLLSAFRTELVLTPDDITVDRIQRIVGNIAMSIRPNVVLRVEIVKELTNDKSTFGKVRIDFAF